MNWNKIYICLTRTGSAAHLSDALEYAVKSTLLKLGNSVAISVHWAVTTSHFCFIKKHPVSSCGLLSVSGSGRGAGGEQIPTC